MEILTNRLIIKPLSEQEMRNYILNDFSLERSLSLEYRKRVIPEKLKTVIENKILPCFKNKQTDYLFFTFLTIIHKTKNSMVADMCFKGEPNENEEVEIGYGTYPEFQGNGYMTEAINAIASWALNHSQVNAIIAETSNKNIASHSVLKKNNFSIERLGGNNIYWRLEKK